MDNENVVKFTDKEIATLNIILRRIGGSPSSTMRGYAESAAEKVYSANERVGRNVVNYSDWEHGTKLITEAFTKDCTTLWCTVKSIEIVDEVVAQDEIVVNGVTYRRV